MEWNIYHLAPPTVCDYAHVSYTSNTIGRVYEKTFAYERRSEREKTNEH